MNAAAIAPSPWLRSARWDMTFLIGSAIVAPAILALRFLVGVPDWFIGLLVAGVIGGPHVVSTFSTTFLDKDYAARHRAILTLSVVIPAIVLTAGIWRFPHLVSFFFIAASLHVLHQLAYIGDLYRTRVGDRSTLSRLIDYGVVFSSIYPFAMQRAVTDDFFIGPTKVAFPEVLKTPAFSGLFMGVFATFAILWVLKTGVEIQRRTVSWPKTFLIGIAVPLCFAIPTFWDLDSSFQAVNCWHAIQYFALMCYLHILKARRGEFTSPATALFARRRGLRFYAICLAGAAVIAGLGQALLHGSVAVGHALTPQQASYTVVFAVTLIHYFQDLFFFVRQDVRDTLLSSPAAPRTPAAMAA